jgi:hypothetical protein
MNNKQHTQQKTNGTATTKINGFTLPIDEVYDGINAKKRPKHSIVSNIRYK